MDPNTKAKLEAYYKYVRSNILFQEALRMSTKSDQEIVAKKLNQKCKKCLKS